MDLNKLTQKTQEGLHEAQNLATRFGHQQVDNLHLLLALLQQNDGLIPRLLGHMKVPVDQFTGELEAALAKRPSVSGPGAGGSTPGQLVITPALQQALTHAEAEAKRLRDEYVSVEHLVLAMLKDDEPIRKLFEKYNINRDVFLALLTKVRGNQRVQSANPERCAGQVLPRSRSCPRRVRRSAPGCSWSCAKGCGSRGGFLHHAR